MNKRKLLVICGGQSTEHSVSRMSCTSVYRELDKNKYEITLAGIDQTGQWYILSPEQTDLTLPSWLEGSQKVEDLYGLIKSFDVVFPVLHGMYGEDGTIQGLLELAKVPYVGCRVLGSSVSMDKIYTKMILEQAGVKQVKSVYVKKRYDGTLVIVDQDFSEHTNIEDLITTKLGYPCFVKASNSGSSVGCYKVNDRHELMAKLEEAAQYDRKIVVEEGINATELECAVLGNDDPQATLVGEILPAGDFYTFESKYEDENSKTRAPALVSDEVTQYIRETAVKVFKAVDGHGLARVDFFLDKDTGEVYLNEINTMPGFTSISMYPKLWEASGLNYQKLLDRLIELAFER